MNPFQNKPSLPTEELENQVLGTILTRYGTIVDVMALLPTALPFVAETEQKVYATMLDLQHSGFDLDVANVNTALVRAYGPQSPQKMPWIASLLGYAGEARKGSGELSYKCLVIWQEYARRQVFALCSDLLTQSCDAATDPLALIDRATASLSNLSGDLSSLSDVPFSDALNEAVAQAKAAAESGTGITGTATLLSDIDRYFKGAQPATLTVLAARPAMGKTALGMQIAHNAAVVQNVPTAFFSLEMNAVQVARRELANQTGNKNAQLSSGMNGYGEKLDFDALQLAVDHIGSKPLYVIDNVDNIGSIRAKVAKLVRRNGVKLVIVDYLQLALTGHHQTDLNDRQRVSIVSRELKKMSRDLDVAVIALAQLNREVENRKGNRPMLADLNHSGSIEQDADNVAFLYRPGYYSDKDENGYPVDPYLLNFIIAKNRNGSTHSGEEAIALHYDMASNRIKDYTTSPVMANF